MSEKVLIVCDRCGAEGEKWTGAMASVIVLDCRGWKIDKGSKNQRMTQIIHLCCGCSSAFLTFMSSTT